jgi:hypothetical protein
MFLLICSKSSTGIPACGFSFIPGTLTVWSALFSVEIIPAIGSSKSHPAEVKSESISPDSSI